MEKDKKSGWEVVVIFLSILVTLLVGYIVYDKVFKNDEVEKESKLLNLSKLKDYKNYDDTYGAVEKFYLKNDVGVTFTLNLGMDGKVYIGNFSTRKDINNVSDVVDIALLDMSVEESGRVKCYMLTDSGDVYVYNMTDMNNDKYEATLLKDVSDVDELIEFYYSPTENAGSSWGVIAILNSGEYVQLDITGA